MSNKGKSELELQTEWLEKLLRAYILQRLYGTYLPESSEPISLYHICYDKRRLNTIWNFFRKKDLILDEGDNTNVRVNVPVIEEHIKASSMEPTFVDKGKVYYRPYSWGEEEEKVVDDLAEVYKRVSKLNTMELSYVYTHQDLYQIKVFKIKTRSTPYYRKGVEYSSLRLYPKSLLEKVSENALVEHCKKFLDENPEQVLTLMLRCKFREISSDFFCTNDEGLSAFITTQEQKIRNDIRLLKELKVFQRKVKEQGEEKILSDLIQCSKDYILRMAPIWVMGDDVVKQKLAKIFLKNELPESDIQES